MENIIIKKTLDYGSRGELVIDKGGKVTTEVIDPTSLRQIMNYVKFNFDSLEDVTIDDEFFSFKYGKYKVTFEFYKSYDFIRENIKNLKNIKPEKISFLNRYDLIVDFGNFKLKLKDYTSYLEIISILNGIRGEKRKITYHIKGDNLYTNIDEIIIELKDYKNFSANKNFKYIFEKIQKQKLKVVKDTIIIGTLVIVSSVGATTLITKVSAEDKSEYEEPKSKLEESVPMPTHFEEEPSKIETTYVDDEPETIKTTKETEIITEIESKTETEIYIENDKYEELGIGSLANDEKLLTTKRLYFDIIEKYAAKYGVDPYLVLAIAVQERGIHSSEIDEGGAIGLMQIQVDVWSGESLTVFDYDKNEYVTFNFDMENLRTVEGSIEAGCVVIQHNEKLMDGNKFAATQSYNSGPNAVKDMIGKYKASSGKTTEEINLENDLGWYDYCTSAYKGDPEYLEHTLRYYIGDIENLELNKGKSMN